MAEDRKAKMLERVRRLLAQAASTPFSEEAETAQRMADNLMSQYAIEEWELAKKGDERQKPISRSMDIAWWYEMDNIEDALWSLFWKCAQHSRCVIVYWKSGNAPRTCPVVGMESDLDYMDLLFTDLMIQVVGQLDPHPDPKLSYYENLKRFREAGMSWPDTARKILEFPQFDPRPADDSFKVKQDQMTRDYRAWCKKTGTPQNYNHYKTFGRNFAAGFVSMIGERMHEMRKETQGEADPTSSTAIAIRDIRLEVRDAATDMFGAPRSTGKAIAESRKVDYGAVLSGRDAGRNARIVGNAPGVGHGRKKELS